MSLGSITWPLPVNRNSCANAANGSTRGFGATGAAEVAVVVVAAAHHRVAEAERRDRVLQRREQLLARHQRLVDLVAVVEDVVDDRRHADRLEVVVDDEPLVVVGDQAPGPANTLSGLALGGTPKAFGLASTASTTLLWKRSIARWNCATMRFSSLRRSPMNARVSRFGRCGWLRDVGLVTRPARAARRRAAGRGRGR